MTAMAIVFFVLCMYGIFVQALSAAVIAAVMIVIIHLGRGRLDAQEADAVPLARNCLPDLETLIRFPK
jgi:hypothetical protein